MTDPAPVVNLTAAKPEDGCTAVGCGKRQTVVLSPYDGRRCADHMSLPPGRFQSDLAAEMVELGRADSAFAYLLGWLVAEGYRRFSAVLP